VRSLAVGLALLALAGCAHRTPPEARIVHHRELVGMLPSIPGERTYFAYAELLRDEGEAPRLAVHLLAPDGSRQPVVHALEEEAHDAARAVDEGASLAAILPAYLAVGLLPTEPPALPHVLGPPLEGMELRLEPVGPRDVALRLVHGGHHVDLHVVAVPRGAELRLVALTSDAAALELRANSRAGRVVDVRAVDLLAGGRRLWTEMARAALDAGALDRADALLLRAELLGAPEEGELWFEKARLYAMRGESEERVVSALARALPFEPALYRMRARTEPAFRRLALRPAFLEAVAPRPLSGRDRVLRVSDRP